MLQEGINYVWTPNSSLTDDSISNPLSFTGSAIQYFVTGVDINGL